MGEGSTPSGKLFDACGCLLVGLDLLQMWKALLHARCWLW